MQVRTWVRSGIVEEFDARQVALLDLVFKKIKEYYANGHRYPLSLGKLARLCKRSGTATALAVKVLANTVVDEEVTPKIIYERVKSKRNKSHRPYRINLRDVSSFV